MEPNRQTYRMSAGSRRRQAGITAIGFLFLACVFGLIGLAAIKVVPLYLQKMRLATVLNDVKSELDGQGPTPQGIRVALEKRFDIEGVDIPREAVKITQMNNGYRVRIQQEQKTPFVADLWFLIVFDGQVEIRR
jgi:Domain of unknown function (DUF4845)